MTDMTPLEVHFEQDCSDTQSYINTKQLTVKIAGKVIINGDNLLINKRVKYGLIGRNGHGKSTLLKAILSGLIKGSVKPFGIDQVLINNGRTVFEEVVSSHAEYMAYLDRKHQLKATVKDCDEMSGDDESVDLLTKCEAELEELEERARERGYYTVEHRAKTLLGGLGFEKTMDQAVNSFSGGWRMRIALSKVLFMKPEFLLLDEPTNHLDLRATVWLSDYLKKATVTLILVTHNMDFLNNVVDQTLEIDSGKLKLYKGNYEKYKRMKSEEFRLRVKDFDKKKGKMSKKERKQLKPYEVQVKIALETDTERKKRFEIRLREVEFKYPDSEHLFYFEDFQCREGDKVVIIGENGSGKSTLIKLIREELKPLSGEILKDPKINFGYLSQNYEEILDFELTPVEFINRFSPHMSEQEVRKLLSRCNLESKTHHTPIGTLSGGEKTRVIFSYIAYKRPNFIVFDEPTNNLDLYTIDTLAELINGLDCGVILVTHDTYLINSLDDHKLYICSQEEGTSYLEEYDGYLNDYLVGGT
jgi:ATPase subunit of ABC transporter with duplicated ATPase domains